MLKIALLGVDSGHFEVFSDIIFNKMKQEMQIHSVWGEDRSQACLKTNRAGMDIRLVKNTVSEALNGANAAMVIGRFAESHKKPAMEALSKKIPVFIDKPVANNLSELNEIIELSKKMKTPFDSFSIYRFSKTIQELKEFIADKNVSGIYLTGPRYCKDLGNDTRFNDIYFYGIHSVEILLEVLGFSVEKIQKIETHKTLTGLVQFSSGAIAAINFASNLEQEFYFIYITTDKGIIAREIKYDEILYEKTIDHLQQFFTAGKKRVENESNCASLEILDFMREGKSL